MKNTFNLILILACVLFSLNLNAQVEIQRSTIAATGTTVQSDGNLSASWTAGETVIGSHLDGTITLSAGFQQGYAEGGVFVDNPEAGINYTVFPNPTYGEINMKLETTEAKTMYYHLYDATGRRIALAQSELFVNGTTTERFSIAEQPAGTYYLRLNADKGIPMGTIKIIKAR